jgi:hypothetical protein
MDCGGFFAGLATAVGFFAAGVFTADFFATPFFAEGFFTTDFFAAMSCLAAGLSIGHPAPDENTMIA